MGVMDENLTRLAVVALVIGGIVALRGASGAIFKHQPAEDREKLKMLGNAAMGVPKFFILLMFAYVTYDVFFKG